MYAVRGHLVDNLHGALKPQAGIEPAHGSRNAFSLSDGRKSPVFEGAIMEGTWLNMEEAIDASLMH